MLPYEIFTKKTKDLKLILRLLLEKIKNEPNLNSDSFLTRLNSRINTALRSTFLYNGVPNFSTKHCIQRIQEALDRLDEYDYTKASFNRASDEFYKSAHVVCEIVSILFGFAEPWSSYNRISYAEINVKTIIKKLKELEGLPPELSCTFNILIGLAYLKTVPTYDYAALNRFENAITFLSKAIEANGSYECYELHFYLAIAHAQVEDYRFRAIDILDKIINKYREGSTKISPELIRSIYQAQVHLLYDVGSEQYKELLDEWNNKWVEELSVNTLTKITPTVQGKSIPHLRLLELVFFDPGAIIDRLERPNNSSLGNHTNFFAQKNQVSYLIDPPPIQQLRLGEL